MQDRMSQSSFLENFALFEKSLNGGLVSPVHAARREALQRFAQMGFPTVKQEEWRFTNVLPIARTSFVPVRRPAEVSLTSEQVRGLAVAGEDALTVVFVNGVWSEEHSRLAGLPDGVQIENLERLVSGAGAAMPAQVGRLVDPGENAFTALNAAFLREGVVIRLAKGVNLDRPIQVLYLSVPGGAAHAAHPRTVLVAGELSRAALVEVYACVREGSYLTNAVTEMVLEAGAVIEHDRLQVESAEGFHVGTTKVHQERGSVFTSNAVSLGGALARNTVTAVLAGEGADCTLNGLSMATGSQLVDNHTVIDHASPHCTSHELYKAILDGRARGVFNGKIFVRAGAQKTDAKQTNKTLLLSDDATINTKPQLEIFADDVKCTHGATVGQLNEEQLFYLRARGIGEEAARDLLTFAFAADVVSRIHVDRLREQLDSQLHVRLQNGRLTNASQDAL